MIKKLDPKARFRIVSQLDDAIDNNDYEGNLSRDRYGKYLDTFDITDLKLVEGKAPTYFVVRPLTNLELAELNARYLVIDAEKKSAAYRDQIKMFLEMFDLACEGMDDGTGVQKVSSGEVPYGVASEVGSIISIIATLGKHVKKA